MSAGGFSNGFSNGFQTGGSDILAPSLVTDNDTFYAATVSSTKLLTPSLLSDGDTFYSATVTPGAITLAPPLLNDGTVDWTPAKAPGLGVWLKADSLSLSDGDPVSSWSDSSGNSHTATRSGSYRPTFKTGIQNSLPGIQFGGSQDIDIATMGDLMSGDDSYSLFVLNKPTTSLASYPIMLTYPTTGVWSWIFEYDPGGDVYWGHVNGNYRLYDSNVGLSDVPILEAIKTTSTTQKFWKDGVEITSYSTYGSGVAATPTMSGSVRLGAYYSDDYGLYGYVFEVVYFSGSLSQADRQNMEGYLAHKWALTGQLDSSHPYKSTPPQFSLDTFYPASISTGLNIAPSLVSDGDTFYASTVAPGAINLSPALLTDADSFYAPAATSTYALAPSLLSDGDSFYSPTVGRGAVNLSPTLVSDPDSFYAVTLTAIVAPPLLTDADSFYAPTVMPGAVNLSPSLVSDADSFYAPTVGTIVRLSPALVTDADAFYSPAATSKIALLPSLLIDSDILYTPTVSALPIYLAASLITDGDTFFSPVATTRITLSAPVIIDPDTVYLPQRIFFASGWAEGFSNGFRPITTALPNLVNDGDNFFTPTITAYPPNLRPIFYNDADLFFTPSLAVHQDRIKVRFAGTWKDAESYLNVSGSWQRLRPYAKNNNLWKRTVS